MDIKTFILELWDLIKKEKWLITLITIIISALSVAVLFIMQSDFQSTEEGEEEIITTPAQFDIYLEEELQGAFTNSYLLEIMLTQEEVIREIENMTQVDIETVLEEFAEENETIYTPEDPINIERNTSSNLMEVTVNIGSDEENLAVADAYTEWLEDNDLEFLSNKNVYILSYPDIIDEEELSMTVGQLSVRNVLIQAIVGIVIGIGIGIFVAVLKVLLSNKIRYGFTYGWASDEIYMKEDSGASIDKVAFDILNSDFDSLVVLSENDLDQTLKDKIVQYDSKNVKITKQISELPISEQYNEFVFLVKRNETTKDWYHSQRKDLKLYPDVRVKIVEI
ncbi:hypothetical protein GCM10008932_18340 [Alkalibacterium iburiense]|uniref:Capsular polysaccharide biosynthesis protein n=1 Tax=Alkalibacterium iburiense TaxID=290589 RepID=A0ABN0XL42_9LACT